MTTMRWLPILTAVVLVVAGGGRASGQVSGSASNIFINEFHYDNAGVDVGERIEIVLPTGTSLTNLNVLLYNGANGQVYDTIGLSSGTLTPAAAGTGFSFVTINVPGIQDGSPDGFALFNGASVIQFLSYEGAFTATNGAANGILSTDVGVAETGNDPAGLSLQLRGVGNTYGDFTWNGPISQTFGVENFMQTLTPVPEPGTLLGVAAAGLGLMRLVRRRAIG